MVVFQLLLFGSGDFLSELGNTASVSSESKLSSIERMALGASIDSDLRRSRTSLKCVSAGKACYLCAIVFRMNVLFHYIITSQSGINTFASVISKKEYITSEFYKQEQMFFSNTLSYFMKLYSCYRKHIYFVAYRINIIAGTDYCIAFKSILCIL